jgi:hypothetical protein
MTFTASPSRFAPRSGIELAADSRDDRLNDLGLQVCRVLGHPVAGEIHFAAAVVFTLTAIPRSDNLLPLAIDEHTAGTAARPSDRCATVNAWVRKAR